MKTVKDVYKEWKNWPSSHLNFANVGDYGTELIFSDVGSSNTVCTREEYEQYKAEQEKVMETKCDWYDYEKGEGVPPVGTECEVSNCGNDYIWCKVVFMGSSICLVDHKTYSEQHYHLGSVKFRPLDHDKYSKKVAPMDWGVKSGIDFEVSEDKKVWFTVKLIEINNNGNFYDGLETWKYCRPRMNHKHVLTYDQYNLMPSDVFEFNILHTDLSKDIIIVEFTGLKDGYVWEGE